MLTFSAEHEGGRLLFLGLTDVNMRRLEQAKPIKLMVERFLPLDLRRPVQGMELVVFHATRQSILDLSEGLGVDPLPLLDYLGEG